MDFALLPSCQQSRVRLVWRHGNKPSACRGADRLDGVPFERGVVGDFTTLRGDHSRMETRISLRDLEIALSAVASAALKGRGALESAAVEHGVNRSVVMDALNRVEAAMGGSLFVKNIRRTGRLSPSGRQFLQSVPDVIRAWTELRAVLVEDGPVETTGPVRRPGFPPPAPMPNEHGSSGPVTSSSTTEARRLGRTRTDIPS